MPSELGQNGRFFVTACKSPISLSIKAVLDKSAFASSSLAIVSCFLRPIKGAYYFS